MKILKKHIRKTRFVSNEELKETVEEYFARLPNEFFRGVWDNLKKDGHSVFVLKELCRKIRDCYGGIRIFFMARQITKNTLSYVM